MAYHKLSQSLIATIVSKLNAGIRFGIRYAWLGRPYSVNIRVLCKRVGISHTTYYRWLREYKALKYKRGLSDHQKLVRAFGRRVAAADRKIAALPTSQAIEHQRLPLVKHTQTETRHRPLQDESDCPNIAAIEKKTAELTAGIRGIEPVTIDSLKDM